MTIALESIALPFGQEIRDQFPVLSQEVYGKPLAYLDNAATSQKPLAVIEAMDRIWRCDNSNVHRGVHALSQRATKDFDRARQSVKTLLNAASEMEVVFTKGCTEAVNLVAHSFLRPKLQPGDVILVTTMEHHSNIVPWQILAEEKGAIVLPIPITDEGEVDLEGYADLLHQHPVKMVGLVYVSNSLGTINPAKQMVAMAHSAGAFALVDGAQAGPHIAIDVQDLNADFFTLSCHKIYAPTGVGVLYGKLAHLEAMPPYQGGGDMIRTVSFEKTTYAEVPSKFEAGTPNIGGVIGLGAAIKWLASLSPSPDLRTSLVETMAKIHDHEVGLMRYAADLLSEIPGVQLRGTSKEKAGIVSFTTSFAHPHDLGTILDHEGIAIRAGHHCCMPLMKRLGVPATARASFALYNTAEEAERLAKAVIKAREMMA